MLEPFTNARTHAKTGQSQKATSLAKRFIQKRGYSICPQLQVTTFISLPFAQISGAKGFKKLRKYVFSQDHTAHVKQSQCLLLFHTSYSER